MMAARLRLPQTKLQKACAFMALPLWDRGNRAVRKKDVQKLSGNVLFWAIVVYPLRLVLPAIWALTAGESVEQWVQAAGNPEEKELAWVDFALAKEFVKLVILQQDRWSITLESPMAFALSPQEILSMHQVDPAISS
jgi:hypothetical protein